MLKIRDRPKNKIGDTSKFNSRTVPGMPQDIAQLADAQVNRLSEIASSGSFELTSISQDTVYNIYERLAIAEGVQGVSVTGE